MEEYFKKVDDCIHELLNKNQYWTHEKKIRDQIRIIKGGNFVTDELVERIFNYRSESALDIWQFRRGLVDICNDLSVELPKDPHTFAVFVDYLFHMEDVDALI